ncbi:(Fe-S)-binding protein [Methylicorpusculum sp.]|uniref:(Fe-S)-binding protein n=1 Tax=Methylicorpusculum sp. TaxID=2713644 RepID=UPI002ABAB95C|nr:(Fe-S)-binding protein [Methylicorpusculum sp.]MDZ4154466.1 (Fe-S)-binding protein [Methylicorpusculum sp.]
MLENNVLNSVLKELPGFNCGACGFANCALFADAVIARGISVSDCPVLLQERFSRNRVAAERAAAVCSGSGDGSGGGSVGLGGGAVGASGGPSGVGSVGSGDGAVGASGGPSGDGAVGSGDGSVGGSGGPSGSGLIDASGAAASGSSELIGLIDGANADFLLHPLPSERSCRETLVCFAGVKLEVGMVIRYRPLGCPIIHFGEIISFDNGLIDIWVVGPCKHLGGECDFVEVGICMVLSFQGVIEGKAPLVGQTVKFLPAHCMMGKVHSGVVVSLESRDGVLITRLDCIDLKVWAHAAAISAISEF